MKRAHYQILTLSLGLVHLYGVSAFASANDNACTSLFSSSESSIASSNTKAFTKIEFEVNEIFKMEAVIAREAEAFGALVGEMSNRNVDQALADQYVQDLQNIKLDNQRLRGRILRLIALINSLPEDVRKQTDLESVVARLSQDLINSGQQN